MKYFFLVLIMFAAFFFRVWRIAEMPPVLYPDEAMNGNNALEALETGGFKTFYSENNGREGLFINIQAISVAAFGNKPWALRLMSSLFGIFTVLGVYFLANELFKKEQSQSQKFYPAGDRSNGKKFKNLERSEIIGLIASFFLATSFWHINFSRIGFRAIMAPFFLVWGLYFLWMSFRKMASFEEIEEKNKPENLKLNLISKFKELKYKIFNTASMKWQLKFGNLAGVAGFIYGLGFHSYIAYRATPVLVLLIFVYFWFKQKENRRKIIFNGFLFLISFFIAVSPLLFYFTNNPQDFLGRTAQISIFSSESLIKVLFLNTVKTLGMFWYQGDFNFRHNIAGEPELFWPVGILFAVGILICIKNIIQILNLKSQNHNSKLKNFQNSKQFKIWNFDHWNLFRNSDLEIRNFKAKNILPELLLLAWLIVGLLPVVISSEGIPHALRAIIILPVVMIISGIALQKIIFKISDWLNVQKEKFSELSKKIQGIKPFVLTSLGGNDLAKAESFRSLLVKITRIQKEALVLLFFFFITVAVFSFNQYFIRFAAMPQVYDAFTADYVKLGKYLNTLPKNIEKYVIVNASGTDVRGMPMPTQTVMFITKTFLPQWQKEKNLYYVLPQNLNEIFCENSCVITMLDNDPLFRNQLKEQIKNLASDGSSGFMVLRK